jgi:hypothetical protein
MKKKAVNLPSAGAGAPREVYPGDDYMTADGHREVRVVRGSVAKDEENALELEKATQQNLEKRQR